MLWYKGSFEKRLEGGGEQGKTKKTFGKIAF